MVKHSPIPFRLRENDLLGICFQVLSTNLYTVCENRVVKAANFKSKKSVHIGRQNNRSKGLLLLYEK